MDRIELGRTADRATYPLTVACQRGPFPGFGACHSHEDCRIMFWWRFDAETAKYAANLERLTNRGTPPPAKSRRRCP